MKCSSSFLFFFLQTGLWFHLFTEPTSCLSVRRTASCTYRSVDILFCVYFTSVCFVFLQTRTNSVYAHPSMCTMAGKLINIYVSQRNNTWLKDALFQALEKSHVLRMCTELSTEAVIPSSCRPKFSFYQLEKITDPLYLSFFWRLEWRPYEIPVVCTKQASQRRGMPTA